MTTLILHLSLYCGTLLLPALTVDCPGGRQLLDETCFPCPIASFSPGGDTPCRLCPEGTFQPSSGAESCNPCPVGTANPERGRARCMPCQSGTYADLTESEECLPCPPGTTSLPGSGVCAPCPLGYFSDSFLSTECSRCPPGTYTPTEGSTECTNCPRGSTEGPAECTECPRGTVHTPGSDRCEPCPLGHTTYRPDTNLCYGPIIEMGPSPSIVRETAVPDVGRYKTHSHQWRSILGDWEVFSRENYQSRSGVVAHGGSLSAVVGSIRPVIVDKFCYTGIGMSYTGYRNLTGEGSVCRSWPGASHNFCRNPDGDPNAGPWCHDQATGDKVSCDIPKCKEPTNGCHNDILGDPTTGVWGRFRGVKSGQCWDVDGFTQVKLGANVAMGQCESPLLPTTDHVFRMDGRGFIINQKSGYCMNLVGDRDRDNKVNYNVWWCQHSVSPGSTDQIFSVEWHPRDTCSFRLRNAATDKCIDAHGKGSSHANVQQYSCKDSDNDDHWYYFLPTTDSLCSYTLHEDTRGSDNLPESSIAYEDLATAQVACSYLGWECGGVTRSGDGVYSLVLGSVTLTPSSSGDGVWVKGGCDEARYNRYYEQVFQEL